jgi:hypothetical protein
LDEPRYTSAISAKRKTGQAQTRSGNGWLMSTMALI